MWFWPKWKMWVKLVVSAVGCGFVLLIILPLLMVPVLYFLTAVSPESMVEKAREQSKNQQNTIPPVPTAPDLTLPAE